MDSTDHRSFAALHDDELDGLVEVVIEQFGSTLDRAQFADVALTMFQDIAGLEMITTKQANRYVAAFWLRYRAKVCDPSALACHHHVHVTQRTLGEA